MTGWFSHETAALIGAIGGSATGLFGGLFGTVAGICVPRGTKKKTVYGMAVLLATTGTTALVAGLTALVAGQPYAVWYPLVLCGGILTFSMSWAIPLVQHGYRQADLRRLEAAQFRRE